MTILLDVESRSRADLKKVGSRLYWEHPSTEVLCVVMYDTDTDDLTWWQPGDPAPDIDGQTLAAHNAMGFDRYAIARLGWRDIDHPTPWVDTMELARRAGLPGSLDKLGTLWLGLAKDKEASRFTIGLSTCRRPTKKTAHRAPFEQSEITPPNWKALSTEMKRNFGVQAELTPEVMQRVLEYCVSDVDIMVEGWPILQEWLEVDAETSTADRVINDRGVGFDVELAHALLDNDARITDETIDMCAHELGREPLAVAAIARAPVQLGAVANLPDGTKATVQAVLDDPTNEGTDRYFWCLARQAVASIARGKLLAGLALVNDDGTLKSMHRYYGAHTGRWSGSGFQLHNLPRPDGKYESWTGEQIDELAKAVIAGQECDHDEINLLLRACLFAGPGHTFGVVDYSGVEARALALLSGDTVALDNIRTDKDPYKVAAATIYNVQYADVTKAQRQVGKVAELALGYQGGPNAFASMAANFGLDLSALDLKAIVRAWRELHAPVQEFWHDVEDAFKEAIWGNVTELAGFTFQPSENGKDVAIFLPSGRPIVYGGARIEQRASNWGKGTKPTIVYNGGKTGTEFLYGGKIVENIIQAYCRDLLAEAMVRVEKAGLPVVMHVHDELVVRLKKTKAREGLELLERTMLQLPHWAADFPIGADGFLSPRYRK